MKKFVIYCIGVLLLVVLMLSAYAMAIILIPSGAYDDSYQAVIERKYDYMMENEDPKIIIVGGSSAGFGVDEAFLEEQTDYRVVNLGLHAGFGSMFPTELAKANLNEGDIILLAYEWTWAAEDFDAIGTELIMSGINERIEMYAHLPLSVYPKCIGYLNTYAEKKSTFVPMYDTAYCATAFDELGRMTFDRPAMTMTYDGNEEVYGHIDIGDGSINPDTAAYLKKYSAYVESKGAKIFFVSCPYYEKACVSTIEELRALAELEEELIGIPFISDPADYCFSDEWMFDTIYHCNNAGQHHRSELILEDLRNAGVIG